MKKQVLCAAAVGGVLLFGGCGNQSGTAEKIAGVGAAPSSSLGNEPKPTAENTAVIINGKPISRALLQSIMADVAQRSGGQAVPEDKVIDGLIARELLNQEAEKENLAKDPAVAAPVKSQFGWHVIQREDSREQAPPAFDTVKDQFRAMLLGQKLQKHVEELKAAAKIERLTPPAPPKPAEPPKAENPAPKPAEAADAKSANPPPAEAGKPVAPAPAAPKPAK